jgi:hypothetical protein
MPETNGPLSFRYGGDHPVFRQPAPEAKIWRYFGLAHLLSTLQKGQLHFSRVDTFKDPFEGSLPKAEVEADQEFYASVGVPKIQEQAARTRASMLKLHAACCWHLAEHESEAMWKLYANEGIAIQSTVGRLVGSLPAATPVEDPALTAIYVGVISYIDYAKDITRPMTAPDGTPRWNNTYIPLMHKRKSFEHERELRAILTAVGDGHEDIGAGIKVLRTAIPPEGCHVPVDLEKLVEQIVVSPSMPMWFVDVVAEAVHRHAHPMRVVRSDLAAAPY